MKQHYPGQGPNLESGPNRRERLVPVSPSSHIDGARSYATSNEASNRSRTDSSSLRPGSQDMADSMLQTLRRRNGQQPLLLEQRFQALCATDLQKGNRAFDQYTRLRDFSTPKDAYIYVKAREMIASGSTYSEEQFKQGRQFRAQESETSGSYARTTFRAAVKDAQVNYIRAALSGSSYSDRSEAASIARSILCGEIHQEMQRVQKVEQEYRQAEIARLRPDFLKVAAEVDLLHRSSTENTRWAQERISSLQEKLAAHQQSLEELRAHRAQIRRSPRTKKNIVIDAFLDTQGRRKSNDVHKDTIEMNEIKKDENQSKIAYNEKIIDYSKMKICLNELENHHEENDQLRAKCSKLSQETQVLEEKISELDQSIQQHQAKIFSEADLAEADRSFDDSLADAAREETQRLGVFSSYPPEFSEEIVSAEKERILLFVEQTHQQFVYEHSLSLQGRPDYHDKIDADSARLGEIPIAGFRQKYTRIPFYSDEFAKWEQYSKQQPVQRLSRYLSSHQQPDNVFERFQDQERLEQERKSNYPQKKQDRINAIQKSWLNKHQELTQPDKLALKDWFDHVAQRNNEPDIQETLHQMDDNQFDRLSAYIRSRTVERAQDGLLSGHPDKVEPGSDYKLPATFLLSENKLLFCLRSYFLIRKHDETIVTE